MNRKLVLATVAAGALAAPAAAQAHVTLQPDTAPAGGFTRLDVRVPNERSDASTRKVVVQMPPGFVFASWQPVPGWTVAVKTRKLATPVKTDDGPIDQEVSQISWTAKSRRDAIPPGAFQDFGLSVGIPDRRPGTKLTFKALQTYTGGEVVRWIGAQDSDRPAPQVTLTAAGSEAADAHGAQEGQVSDARTTAATASDTPSRGLVIAALVAGGLGLLAGLAGFAAGRSRA
jgi:uncharacterized protein YcnI